MYINHFLKAWVPGASMQFLVFRVKLKIAWLPPSQNYLCSVSTQETFKRSRPQVWKQPFANAIKNMSLKFRNIHSKISVLEALFNKIAVLQTCNFIEKWLQQRCFHENITQFLRTAFLQNISSGWFYRCSTKKAVLKHFSNFTRTYHHRSSL